VLCSAWLVSKPAHAFSRRCANLVPIVPDFSVAEAMRRRSKAGDRPNKVRLRRKATAPKHRDESTARHRSSSIAGLEADVARLTGELNDTRDQQSALAEVLGTISRSRFELQQILESVVQTAARLCHAKQAVIFRLDGGVYRFAAGYSINPAYLEIEQRSPISPGPGTLVGRAAMTRQVARIDDAWTDPLYEKKEDAKIGEHRSMIGVPLMRDGEPIGVIGLSRSQVDPFSEREIELVTTFADQSVIAIENARLLNELRKRTDDLTRSLADLRTTQDRLVQTQKLASLGQLTAGIAHEIKNPLNFVNNFSGVSIELIDELQEALQRVQADDRTRGEIRELADTLRDNLGKIVLHGRRADAIVKNMLLHSREGSGEHRPVDINVLVEEALNLAYHGARAEKPGFTITLQRSFDQEAGQADVFPQDIIRVLLNLISNAFYAATKRKGLIGDEGFQPAVAALTRSRGDRVEIGIRDNGTGIPPEVREKMFNPFFTTKQAGEGTGLGLSISYDIVVKQHAGSIEVDTRLGEFTEIRIVLPRSAAHLSVERA
jgi:two-component system, NtrC family, sensor kinase